MTVEAFGRAAAHPLAPGPLGGVREAAGVERVEQSIRIILGTQHGERVMRPTFGANLRSLAFAPNTPATAILAQHLVEAALARWEPRIEVVRVSVTNDLDHGQLAVAVFYRLAGTRDVRGLTYPVSLEAGS